MAEPDGSICVDTDIDDSGFKSGSDKLKKAINGLNSSLKSLGTSTASALKGSNASLDKAKTKYSSIQEEIERVSQELDLLSKKRVSSDEYLDTQEVKEYQAELERLIQSQKALEAAGATEKDSGWQITEGHIKKIKENLDELKNNSFKLGADTEEYAQLSEYLDDLKAKAEELKYDLNQADEDSIVNNLVSDINKASDNVDKLQAKFDRLKATGVNQDSMQFKNLQYDLELANDALNELEGNLNDIKNDDEINLSTSGKEELDNASQTLNEAQNKAAALGSELMSTGTIAGKAFVLIKAGAKGAISVLGKIGKTAVKGFKLLGNGIKTVVSRFSLFNKKSGSTEGAIKKLGSKLTGLWGMLKRMVTRKILQGVIQGVKDGINNLAQYSGDVNNNLSTLKSGLTQLKNSLATAFAPILSVVTPILAKLLSYLSAVITKIGQFFSALTGKSTFVKAVKVQEDYAASLNNTAKSSDKAAKANKKYGDTLDIDEVHDIQSISDESSSESSGTSASDMFEETEIESGIADFAKKILNDIKSGNWDAAGNELGNKLNGITNKIDKFILGLKPKSIAMASNFASFINGIFKGVSWANVGKTIADGTNLITETIVAFVDTANWLNYGSSLSSGLNSLISNIDTTALGKTLTSLFKIGIDAIHGFLFGDGKNEGFNFSNLGTKLGEVIMAGIRNIDWTKAGEDISGILIGLIDLISATIVEIDWQEVGNDIADCLAAIDWNGLVDSLMYGLGAALAGLALLIWGLIEDAWDSVVEWWKETAYEDGEFTIEGLLDGIVEALSNIGKWITDHIFTPFIDGFKNAFGIASPSKVMKKQGGFIVDGLKNGLLGLATAGLGNISTLSASMSTRFTNFKNNAITWGKDICKNLASGISNNLSTVSNAVNGVANKIKALIGFSEPDEGPLSKFHTFMPDMLKLMAQGIYQNEDIALDAVNDVASNISDKIKSGDYTFSSFDFDKDIDTSLNGFSDKIVDSFDDLLVKLQAIAESVTFTTPQITSAVVPYSVNTPDPRYYNSNDDFFDELIRRLEGFIKSIKFDDQNNITEITLVGDVIIDGTRAGTVLAKPVVNEINRAKIPLNINAK